jgi:hypothetical protein
MGPVDNQEEKSVGTTTLPITELKPETAAAVVEVAEKAAETIKAETPPATAPVELIPAGNAPAHPNAQTLEREPDVLPETGEVKPAGVKPVLKVAPKIKIVINHYAGAALVGVQRGDADPIFTLVNGSIKDAVARIPDLLVSASEMWAKSAKNPVAVLPTKPATTSTSTKGYMPPKPSTPVKPAAPKPGEMKSMM